MEINVLIDGNFAGCPDKKWFRKIAEQVLMAQSTGENVELGLVITSQEKVQELNRTYRGVDKPTDVLAFNTNPATGKPVFPTPPDGIIRLGEVIISYPQTVRQAMEREHPVKRELAILIIHGVLHLLRYDHEKPGERRTMRTREAEILSSLSGELAGEQ